MALKIRTEIPKDTLDKLIPSYIAQRAKLIAKVKEQYRSDPKAHRSFNLGDTSFIEKLTARHLFIHY